MRSIDERHRRALRRHGIATPDLLVGRLSESDPALPAEIEPIAAREPPDRTIEWMVHPGYRDPGSGSGDDAGREEDLQLVLALSERLRRVRCGPRRALGHPS